MTVRICVAATLAYLVGAIPTSYLVARWIRGVDLRTVGSGNLGATNLYRMLGWKYALPVAVFDAAKGAFPVIVLAPWCGFGWRGAFMLGAIAVLGHVFSVFVRFKGGKGVATSAGVVLGLAPGAFGATAALWVLVLAATGYVSLASVCAALALPLAVWVLHPMRRDTVPWLAVLALAVLWFHRANIRRLLAGTENRFGARATAARPRT